MTLKNFKFMYQLAAALFLLDAAWCLNSKGSSSYEYMFSFLAGLLFLILAELCKLRQSLLTNETISGKSDDDLLSNQRAVKQE